MSFERALNGGTLPGRNNLVNDNYDSYYLGYALCLNGIATNEGRVINRYKQLSKIQEELFALAGTIYPLNEFIFIT